MEKNSYLPDDSLEASRARWDKTFLDICECFAKNSKCLSRKIGAILVKDKVVIAQGWNGPPRGIPHCGKERRLSDSILFQMLTHTTDPVFGDDSMCPRRRLGMESGAGLHLCPALHGEENCIINAARMGISTKDSTMYMNCAIPCKDCMKKIINAGIKEIVCTGLELYDPLSKWMLESSKVKMRVYSHL